MPPRPRWIEAVRLRAGLIAAAYLLALLLGASVILIKPQADEPGPTAAAWRLLGVRVMDQDFADLRSVTHRWPCVRSGLDGYADGACDPWERKFNYPPVWLAPARLGWGPEATHPIALVEIVLLFAALWTLFPARTLKGSIVVGVLALSTPVMFALERGNVDLLIFAGLVLGLRATRDLDPARRDVARGWLFAILAFLKLFPIAAFAVLARSPRRALWAVGAALATALGLMLAYRGVLPLLQANTIHEFETNYGRLALFAADPAVSAWRSPQALTSLVYTALVGGLGMALGLLRRSWFNAAFGDLLDGSYLSDLAAVGVAIFALTFLIGLNYDYRLIFLLPVFPLLFDRDGGRWATPAGAAAAVLLVRLVAAHRVPDFWLGAVDWVIFGFAVAWAAAAVVGRLKASRLAPTQETLASLDHSSSAA